MSRRNISKKRFPEADSIYNRDDKDIVTPIWGNLDAFEKAENYCVENKKEKRNPKQKGNEDCVTKYQESSNESLRAQRLCRS